MFARSDDSMMGCLRLAFSSALFELAVCRARLWSRAGVTSTARIRMKARHSSRQQATVTTTAQQQRLQQPRQQGMVTWAMRAVAAAPAAAAAAAAAL
jgi:hypothetical protein